MNIKSKLLRICAFSLIELMVVVAIIAVLAAVALPAYNSMLRAASLTSFQNAIMRLVQQSIEFSNLKNTFAEPHDLGYAQQVGDGRFVDPSVISEAISPLDTSGLINMSDWSQTYGFPVGCGAVGGVNFVLNTPSLSLLGFDSSVNQLAGNCWFWHQSNDVISIWCNYGYGDGNSGTGSQSGNIFPGWTNLAGSGGQWWGSPLYTEMNATISAAAACQ